MSCHARCDKTSNVMLLSDISSEERSYRKREMSRFANVIYRRVKTLGRHKLDSIFRSK